MGPSQHCGHYTAIAEASNGSLYLFDDCSVRLISVNAALSTGAYILIYERVPSSEGASTAPVAPTTNGAAKTNGLHSTNPPVATVAPPPPKVMVPRPALITEPSRPKVSITFKKSEPVQQQQQKPRLVIRNGATSLFKTAAPLGPMQPAPPGSQANGVEKQPANVSKVPLALTSVSPTKASSPLKPPTALVPYDGESSDEELEKSEKVDNTSAPSTSSSNGTVNGTSTESVVVKATEPNWQVSPSPTPSGESNGSGATHCNNSAAKWRVSENNQQDNTSNGTSSSSGSSHGKWNVRSMSDTEVERTNPALTERKAYHSDNETDKQPSSKVTKPVGPAPDSTKNPVVSTVKIEPSQPAVVDESSANVRKTPAVLSPETDERVAVTKAASPRPVAETVPPVDKPVKNTSNPKWDGTRSSDTVKELLRMSHSGFGDQGKTFCSCCSRACLT